MKLKVPLPRRKTEIQKLQEQIDELKKQNELLRPVARAKLYANKPKPQKLPRPVTVLDENGEYKTMDIYSCLLYTSDAADE